MAQKYDIFISYRRETGAQYARIIQLMLIQRGYRVFLDYDELKDGIFSEKIQAAIIEAPIFMHVLSKDSLVRCANEGDWVRREIMLAIEQKKHIIPINPDNNFNGLPDNIPTAIREAIGSHQHSEISFGQALGVTIDLLIQNRIAPTVGVRTSEAHKDNDFTAAQETLRRQEAHQRFMKRVAMSCGLAVVLIALCVGFFAWEQIQERQALSALRTEIQERHQAFGLKLSPELTERQMLAIDTILMNMKEVRPDTLWMSKYEFTIGQWHSLLGEPFDEADCYVPMSNVSFGEISMFLIDMNEKTQVDFALPSVEDWAYAAHGGKYREATIYCGDSIADQVAWYGDNSDGEPHPSNGQQGKKPNYLDLYDMSGNIAEMCLLPIDALDDKLPVCGGDYNSPAEAVRIDSIRYMDINDRDYTVGFRICINKQ